MLAVLQGAGGANRHGHANSCALRILSSTPLKAKAACAIFASIGKTSEKMMLGTGAGSRPATASYDARLLAGAPGTVLLGVNSLE